MHLGKDLKKSIKALISSTAESRELCKPEFYRIKNTGERAALADLITERPNLQVFDTIENQLQDLIKGLNPKVIFNDITINEAITKYLNGTDLEEYGVWVYYPWAEKLVHMLDEQEFIQVRTGRNKHKITQEEQDQLIQRKIGVIGLSVGQSVSLTLAIERGCGELRIADFDLLDLTNLNRIRAGVSNVGLKKTVIVAREIAEIDPFLKVSCFHEGITEENIDAFITNNGKLDLLIDECDGIDIKILCRLKAKKYQIPVLMEASDRGTIDIERFDLDPARPILHGYIEHLDVSKVKFLKTNEEKVPYILPIAGVETLSTRMKASMMEIEQTITSWPQLASAVAYGGGITADLARRILLKQLSISGRFFVDIEEIISDPKTESKQQTLPFSHKKISFKDIEILARKIKINSIPNRVSLKKEELDEIMITAQRAASAGNNQPWKWFHEDNSLYLFHDEERSSSFANQDNIVAYLAFGLALESVRLKAESLGLIAHEMTFPDKTISLLIAVIQFSKADANLKKDPLADFTGIRHTNRNVPTIKKSIDSDKLREIKKETELIKGAKFYFTEEEDSINTMAQVMGESDKLRLFTPTGHHELFNMELRWTKEQSKESGDGLDLTSFELTPLEAIGMRLAKDPEVLNLLKDWKMGSGLERMSRKAGNASSALGLITMSEYNAANFIEGGKAIERAWLTANKNKISVHPMTASILHFNILKFGKALDNDEFLKEKFSHLSNLFYKCFPETNEKEIPVFLFRLFYAENSGIPSERLPMNQIFMSNLNT
jgi:molybdopterin/thiamine biosynthesis adenylyltransferase